MAAIQVFAVFNHEPFALLILPALAIAAYGKSRSWLTSCMLVLPGLLAFVVAALKRGDWFQVQCLGSDLQRLKLLPPGALPGSSITELALSKPSFFTWDLLPDQLSWSLVHGLVMSFAAVSAYALLMNSSGVQRTWTKALILWLVQCLFAMPLFLATIDYGRWLSMMFGAGLFLILICLPPSQTKVLPVLSARSYSLIQWNLLLVEILVFPSHCCTYSFGSIFDFVPYAGLSQAKAVVFRLLL